MLIRIIIFFISAFLLAIATLQTPWVQEKVARQIEKRLAAAGIHLSIGTLEGNLPLHCKLSHVTLHFPDQTRLQIEELRLRLGLESLWNQGWHFPHIEALGIHGKQLPSFNLSMSAKQVGPTWTFAHMDAKRKDESELSGALSLNANGTIEKGTLYLHCVELPKQLALIPEEIRGKISGRVAFAQNEVSIDCLLDGLEYAHTFALPSLHLISKNIAKKANGWEIDLQLLSHQAEQPISATLRGECGWHPHYLNLSEIKLDLLGAQCEGNLKIGEDKSFGGSLYLQIPELQILRSLLPEFDLSGKVEGKIHFAPTRGGGLAEAYLTLEEFGWFTTQVGHAEMALTFLKNGSTYEGKSTVAFEELSSPVGSLEHFFLATTFNEKQGEFELDTHGHSYGPFQLESHGHFLVNSAEIHATIDQLKGRMLGKAFQTHEPLIFDLAADRVRLTGNELHFGEGRLSSHFDLTPSSAVVKMRGEKLPLDLLQYLGFKPKLEGALSLDTSLICLENHVEGYLKSFLENDAHLTSRESLVPVKGWLMAQFHRETVQIQSELRAFSDQYASFSATLPVNYLPEKRQLIIKNDLPLYANLNIEGDCGEIGSLFHPLGPHVSGRLSCHLLFSKTLSDLYCSGPIELHCGSYINDMIGLTLREIELIGSAQQRSLFISSLHAKDEENGHVEASGILHLERLLFPHYTFEVRLEEFQAVSSDFVRGTFSGPLLLKGDKTSASLQGDLFAHEIDFKIPEQMPSVLPDLDITYVNFPQKNHPVRDLQRTYPLYLDLDVTVNERFFVTLKGLSSEWKGKLHMKGTPLEPLPSGQLSLVKGEYLFAGKLFTLNQGEIGLSARAGSHSAIHLSGSCELPNMVATAILRGPLTSPSLSFQSTPPMATSDLLARILFDQNPDEISPIQGLQLAQTLLNLSGSSTVNPFEKIRNLLRIDRLNIAASKQDPTKLAVEVGKYIAKGVLLSFAQNGERSEISMQAGLAPGFVLQAEVGQEQHGKISLKWHYDY